MNAHSYFEKLRSYVLRKLMDSEEPLSIVDLTEEDGRLIFQKGAARALLMQLVEQGVIEIQLLTTLDSHDITALYSMSPLQRLACL